MPKIGKKMILSIHQPNFMPWYPLIQKIEQSDFFVFMTHCQFERRGYQHRFKINDKWHTMSVNKGNHRDSMFISNVTYNDPINDWNTIKNRLPQYKEKLELFDDCISTSLSKTNISIINSICKKRNITTKISYDYQTKLSSNERLINICKKNDADTYLSGIGAKEYLDVDLFRKEGIEVIFQEDLNKIHCLDIL